MQDRFKWLWLLSVCVVIVAIFGLTYFSFTTVPFRQFDVKMMDGFHRIERNERLEHFIKRSKWDFLIAPGPERRDQLHFAEAWQKGDQVVLVFRKASSSGIVIIYVFALRDEKPLWKSSAPKKG